MWRTRTDRCFSFLVSWLMKWERRVTAWALPKQPSSSYSWGKGGSFSLWGKNPSDPSLILPPASNRRSVQCGIQSHWITPSHSNWLSKSLLFTVKKCRWETCSAVQSPLTTLHVCREARPSPAAPGLSILSGADESCCLTPGPSCRDTTLISQHAECAPWAASGFGFTPGRSFSWFWFHQGWLMLMAKRSWDQDLCNQQELEQCQLPKLGTPKAIHHPHPWGML